MFTSQKHAAYEHSGDEGTRFVMSRSLVLRPIAAVKAPLDIWWVSVLLVEEDLEGKHV